MTTLEQSLPDGRSQAVERLLPARAWFASDTARIDLSGTWAFALRTDGESPAGSPAVDFDDGGWDRIAVPSHWVLSGDGAYGRPQYTNVVLPIPLDPPHVPDHNPTGTYRRTFVLDAAWFDGGRVIVRTEGIESEATIWINGQRLGACTGSRLAHEFDATDLLRPGENLVVARVRQWSSATYLEDQDQWWMPGIFREIVLLHRPSGCIDDVWLRAGFDHGSGTGTIDPEIVAGPDAWPITLRIPELGVEETWADAASVRPLRVGAVQPWSAEVPFLYDADVVSRAETVRLRLGFRTVRIRGRVLEVNGRPITIRGVNRHEVDTDHGRVFDEERARRDLILMKQHNVDGIRTSHYPPHPRLLDLADELGLWVLLECDLETHAFLHAEPEWGGNPVDDPAWADDLLDRMQRTVERDKNHPSIIIWSPGNESGTGQNIAAMIDWTKRRDPGRPVVYEGDYSTEHTQIYARMYPTYEEIDAALAETGPVGVASHPASRITADQEHRARTLPYLLIEYAHAMGTGPGGLAGYADRILADDRILGGFVWEWRDHTLRATAEDGTAFPAYGGDFGEEVHDGNFCADGLVAGDDRVRAGLVAYAQVFAPVTAECTDAGIEIRSQRVFTDTSDLRVQWSVALDGDEIGRGTVSAPPVPAGDRLTVEEPGELTRLLEEERRAGELTVTLEVVLAEDVPWAPAGHVISWWQQAVRSTAPAAPRSTFSGEPPAPVRLDASTGDPLDIGGVPVTASVIELWRAPTDNDLGRGPLEYETVPPSPGNVGEGSGVHGVSAAERWRWRGLDRLQRRTVLREGTETGAHTIDRWMPAGTGEGVDAEFVWSMEGDIALCDVTLRPVHPSNDGIWPRAAWRLQLPDDDWMAEWYGLGPGESYPDLMDGVRLGRWSASIDDLAPNVARPQESGHRSGLRRLLLTAPGRSGLRIDVLAGDPGFSLRRWDAQELAAASHPHLLPPPRAAHLSIELGMHGIGTRSCGPDVRPEHALRPHTLRTLLAFSALPE
ncbi:MULTISPECIES: glycoside hydrolase family 2 TIM barrel-domain containing protein [unclassified Microbacterium]|uniref:glycoside hydrolase family 2 TIM barrel-domain containing protein n=1 Tax=unclassified Microbacterium TaxID=2609290 RepID=UPI0012FBB581|nr:glycoside hydrolase family 2 TIM barrel-domain containing protein [Microbacterium sp. MAH-37]MVQ41253.1 DUF4981 domain-containing protein [Microbacterium sp. MAH-37]